METTPIKNNFLFVLDVMGHVYDRVNNEKGIFTYTILKDPIYIVVRVNPDKELNMELFEKVFREEATLAISNANKKLKNQYTVTKHLAPAKVIPPKEIHDSITIHIVDGNKTDPIKHRKPNTVEKAKVLKEKLIDLWGPNFITGEQYKSLKGKLMPNHASEKSIDEVIRFIRKLRATTPNIPYTNNLVYTTCSKILNVYDMFCEGNIAYEDWTDTSTFEYLTEFTLIF